MNGFEAGNAQDHVLSQAEIDSFFGNDSAVAGPSNSSGIERVVSTSGVSSERLPMLEVVFDRFTRILTTSLRNFTSDNVEASMDRLGSQRFGDYLENVPGQAMFAVFKAEEWDNYGIVVLSSPLIYSIVDALLGGHVRSDGPTSRETGRHHTAIERALIEPMVRIILDDLETSFSPLCAVNFHFERLEMNSRFAMICRAGNGVVTARFGIDMEGRGGDVDIVLPHATLEPVRDILLQQFMGEKFGHDGMWETHLAQELWQTDLTLEAVLEEQTVNLKDIMKLAPGDQLILRRNSDAPVSLRCGEHTLFTGRVGRRQGQVAVKIEEVLNQKTGTDRVTSYS
ncbi:flagellar motor switch protein FliM [Gluconobacter sp. Dm-62]|nr:flagellar motor switch protein FliM [Gluconobacter sp. Dm-62]MBS1102542.1 flagellar motor switch protein FliM [Gluconobacter sp. Dm-62]